MFPSWMKPEAVDEMEEPSGSVMDMGECDVLVNVNICAHEDGRYMPVEPESDM